MTTFWMLIAEAAPEITINGSTITVSIGTLLAIFGGYRTYERMRKDVGTLKERCKELRAEIQLLRQTIGGLDSRVDDNSTEIAFLKGASGRNPCPDKSPSSERQPTQPIPIGQQTEPISTQPVSR